MSICDQFSDVSKAPSVAKGSLRSPDNLVTIVAAILTLILRKKPFTVDELFQALPALGHKTSNALGTLVNNGSKNGMGLHRDGVKRFLPDQRNAILALKFLDDARLEERVASALGLDLQTLAAEIEALD